LYVNKAENIDFESISSYSLGVTVSDGTKTSSEEVITINITDDPNAFIVDNFTVKVYRDGTKTGVVNTKGNFLFFHPEMNFPTKLMVEMMEICSV
jgi:hypothetical protein